MSELDEAEARGMLKAKAAIMPAIRALAEELGIDGDDLDPIRVIEDATTMLRKEREG